MTFKELRIIDPILRALEGQGYTHPTPIQQQAIPLLLRGKDLLGCAQTGTGKTAAFAIPILQHLFLDRRHDKTRRINALIITPTRELAIQIDESFTAYGKYTGLRNTVVFGGVKQGAQTQRLRRGVDILVATPGRLLDLMNQGFISLNEIKYFVLDEADHMLDMGFIHDIKKVIAKLPEERQSLFFSATMPADIIDLSKGILGNPEKITIKPQQTTADRVEQALYYVSKKDKPQLLLHLLRTESVDSALIFSRTKYGADKIVKFLGRSDIRSAAIHGNKSQGARQKALGNFKNGDTNVLVATDIAARGIDVDDLSHVINFDLPNIPETYVHRIGRTGRASASGMAISFCDGEERAFLKDIQKLIAQDIEVISEHPYVDDNPVSQTQTSAKSRSSRSSNRPYRGNSRGGNRSYGNSNGNRGSRRPNSRSRGA